MAKHNAGTPDSGAHRSDGAIHKPEHKAPHKAQHSAETKPEGRAILRRITGK